jgi:predicted DsbA family dithiol-disulfide isomerase
MMESLRVDIWSDVMCPWCAVGYTQFAKAVEQLAREVAVDIRWMPFELNPDMSPEGKPQARHLAEVYGRSETEVEATRAQMQATAARAGFAMDYIGPNGEGADHPPEPMMWNTLEAHKLLRWALATAGPEAQTRLKLAFFAAHFQQRRNVSDRAVLLDIAAAQGLDPAAAAAALDDEALTQAVRHEERRGREAGINSVPTFVVNERYILQGANEPEVFRSALVKLASMEAAA